MTTRRTFPQDPVAKLPLFFDWKALTNGTDKSDWLAAGETITAFEVTADVGITVDQPVPPALINGNTVVQLWVSGGMAGGRYQVACKITTSAGRVDKRTLVVDVYEQ